MSPAQVSLTDDDLRMLIDVLKGELITLNALKLSTQEADWFGQRVRAVEELKERLKKERDG